MRPRTCTILPGTNSHLISWPAVYHAVCLWGVGIQVGLAIPLQGSWVQWKSLRALQNFPPHLRGVILCQISRAPWERWSPGASKARLKADKVEVVGGSFVKSHLQTVAVTWSLSVQLRAGPYGVVSLWKQPMKPSLQKLKQWLITSHVYKVWALRWFTCMFYFIPGSFMLSGDRKMTELRQRGAE